MAASGERAKESGPALTIFYDYVYYVVFVLNTHKASLFKTRATLSDSAVRWDRAAAKQFMDRQYTSNRGRPCSMEFLLPA